MLKNMKTLIMYSELQSASLILPEEGVLPQEQQSTIQSRSSPNKEQSCAIKPSIP